MATAFPAKTAKLSRGVGASGCMIADAAFDGR
jgi:hypothetical protein